MTLYPEVSLGNPSDFAVSLVPMGYLMLRGIAEGLKLSVDMASARSNPDISLIGRLNVRIELVFEEMARRPEDKNATIHPEEAD